VARHMQWFRPLSSGICMSMPPRLLIMPARWRRQRDAHVGFCRIESSPLTQVLLLAPQLVGAIRIACVAAALAAGSQQAATFVALLLASFCLDALDGHLARSLNQATAFGAFLDVLIDNASRAVVWVSAIDGPAGIAVPLLEMTVFTCTHAVSGVAVSLALRLAPDLYGSMVPDRLTTVMRRGAVQRGRPAASGVHHGGCAR
jgi:phosphatidylglycerophosphate synthase